MSDRVVAGGEQEPVPFCPLGVVRVEPELVRIGSGQHVGRAEGLADVALALDFAHGQGMVPDPVRRGADAVEAFGCGFAGDAGGLAWCLCFLDENHDSPFQRWRLGREEGREALGVGERQCGLCVHV